MADADTAAPLKDFLAQAIEFFGEHDIRRVFSVASALGQLAVEHDTVRTFLKEGLQGYPRESPTYQFVRAGIASWVFSQRRQGSDKAAELVNDLLDLGTSDKNLDLLSVLYGPSSYRDEALLNSSAESELVRDQKHLFVQANAVRDYVACTLWSLRHDWPDLKGHLTDVLNGAGCELRADAMRELAKRLHQVIDAGGDLEPPADLLEWYWHQLIATPQLDSIDHDGQWHLKQILKALGRVPISWLVDAVRLRAAMRDGAERFRLDPPAKLLPLVDLITVDNAHTPEVQDVARALVEMVTEVPIMGYWLPSLLAGVDPQGLEVPRRLAALIEDATDPEKVRKLSRAACYYGVGTPAWRQIARPAFKATPHFSKEQTEEIYDSVSEIGHVFHDASPVFKKHLSRHPQNL